MASTRRVVVEPILQQEGHGRIDIFLNEQGRVERAHIPFPELRGFERLAQGRPAEEMPQITSRICGACPMAHRMASTKALDALYGVTPPPAAQKIRELVYSTFILEDHALHVYFPGGPDFMAGPDASAAERNVSGMIAKVGRETGLKAIAIRGKLRELMAVAAANANRPMFGLPGGVARPLTREDAARFRAAADEAVEFACLTLHLFEKTVLANSAYVDLILSEPFTHSTYYMGLVDDKNRANFYSGSIRVVAPNHHEWAKFPASDYRGHLAEHTEPWSCLKFCYLKEIGWSGFTDGEDSGVYCVAPLARLNAAGGMATPLADEAYLKFHGTLGGRPVHHTLANHWARVVEMVYAAERMRELASDPELLDPVVRIRPTEVPREGVGVVEAPLGTLFHDYRTDERGIVTGVRLIAATQSNAARITMSVEKAAQPFIAGGSVSDHILNSIELAFRAYDPCMGCATHSLPGSIPLAIHVHDARGTPTVILRRDADGAVQRE
jgi:F420-non-reducing hydrogenase large subunit